MIYGHLAPCIVSLIDGGPAVMVEPLRFIPVSELSAGLHGSARSDCPPALNNGGRSGEVSGVLASPGNQMRAVSTPRSPSGSCPTPAPLGHPSR